MGFANAISFKDIDEADIDSVENYIKYDALNNAVDRLEQSVEGDFDSVSFCLHHQQLIEIFGEIHASNPSEFRFERGDRMRIRCIVEYVKDIVDGAGKLKGLGHFELKRKTKPANILMPLQKKRTLNVDKKPKKSINELKSELHRRILDVLKLHGINIDDPSDEMVEVEPNGNFGLVNCIVCKQNEGVSRKLRPKRQTCVL